MKIMKKVMKIMAATLFLAMTVGAGVVIYAQECYVTPPQTDSCGSLIAGQMLCPAPGSPCPNHNNPNFCRGWSTRVT